LPHQELQLTVAAKLFSELDTGSDVLPGDRHRLSLLQYSIRERTKLLSGNDVQCRRTSL
jgi:hypothetical protein